MIRTGLGYDVHPLVAGIPLVVGGVTIPAPFGAQGHSDGDVLIHASVDAILGAAGLGDIGQRFPSSDERYRGADSRRFLEAAMELVRQAGYELEHLDSVVILQEPRLAEYIPQMRRRIARTLGVNATSVSVKATTTDRLGFIGSGQGVAAQAVATISRS